MHSDTSGLPIDKMPLSITGQAPGIVRNPDGDPLQFQGSSLPACPGPKERQDPIRSVSKALGLPI